MQSFSVLIVGSRSFDNEPFMALRVAQLKEALDAPRVISGAAKGADKMAAKLARANGIPVEEFPAKWGELDGVPKEQIKHGRYGAYNKLAGFERNSVMVAQAPDLTIAFLAHPLAESRGTADTIRKVLEAGLALEIHEPDATTLVLAGQSLDEAFRMERPADWRTNAEWRSIRVGGQTSIEEQMVEGPLCPSCDGSVPEGAVTCPCGAVVDDEVFWQDPMPGCSLEERASNEVILENEERRECGAPLIPTAAEYVSYPGADL